MDKNLARKNWSDCLKLVTRGYASEVLPHPIENFARDFKTGKYDGVPSDEFTAYVGNFNEMTFGMWCDGMGSTAGDVLLNALKNTNITNEELDEIIEILSTASQRTHYKEEQIPPKDSAPIKSAIERSKGRIRNDDWILSTHSPKEIECWLHTDGGIVGQDEAVKIASIIMYNHLQGRPSVSLFCGPTGSGKTQIWRSLQRMFGSNKIVIHDGSTLTAEGWKGGNKISTIFQSIFPDDREHVVLVIDEADKLLEPQYSSGDANYSFTVQNQLLKLFDHDTLFFGNDSGKDESFTLDASGISIVLTGAFQTLLQMKSAKTGSIGFGGQSRKNLDYSNTTISTDDLIESGMRQELCGRVNRITVLDPLDENTLMLIAKNELKRLEKLVGREVSIDNDTLAELANEALDKGLGARWLNSQLSNALDEQIYERPDAERYCLGRAKCEADLILSA